MVWYSTVYILYIRVCTCFIMKYSEGKEIVYIEHKKMTMEEKRVFFLKRKVVK